MLETSEKSPVKETVKATGLESMLGGLSSHYTQVLTLESFFPSRSWAFGFEGIHVIYAAETIMESLPNLHFGLG